MAKVEKKKRFDQVEKVEALAAYFIIVNREQSKYFIDKFNEESVEKMKYSSPIMDEIKKAEAVIDEVNEDD